MYQLKFLIAVLLIGMFYSCNETEKQVDKFPESVDIKKDIVDNKATLTSAEFNLIKKIGQNSNDPKDSLVYLAESAMGTTIESLGKEAWVINMWYGGSYEDILVYQKSDKESYTRILWVAGAVSFKVQDSTDNGLKRIQIRNNRTEERALFVYNGIDYSTNFYRKQGRLSLRDPAIFQRWKKWRFIAK